MYGDNLEQDFVESKGFQISKEYFCTRTDKNQSSIFNACVSHQI